MNEIEKILSKGVITKDFLNEEVRNDFLVTTERKKLWAIMFDLLMVYDEVCRKFGLTYYLWSGSMLGAVRHHGMIPWDDDIDVIMPRSDYEKFLQLSSEFKEPYFFQTPYTDPECLYAFVKIRNSNTTGVVDKFAYQKFNHGIWISVLPLDNWELEGGEQRYEKLRNLLIDCSTYMRHTNPHLSQIDKTRVEDFMKRGIKPLDLYEEIFAITGQTKNKPSEYVAHDSCTLFKYNSAVYSARDFQYPIYVDVEGFSLPIPNGYDTVLKTMYGDYMQLPPLKDRKPTHYYKIYLAE